MVVLRIISICCFCLLCVGPVHVHAISMSDAQKVTENQLKVAFFYNFIRFANWPDAAFPKDNVPFKICVASSNDSIFQVLSANDVHGRKIEVVKYKVLSDLIGCQAVFIGKEKDSNFIKQVMHRIKNKPILVVGESEDFLDVGGMIRLKSINGKLAFEINNESAKESGLTLSSKMLALARNRQIR